MKNTISIIIALALLVFAFLYFTQRSKEPVIKVETVFITDTIVRVDTVEITKFVVQKEEFVRVDTFYTTDSIFVEIPITRKTYNDSLFFAVVSGYKPNLDSIRFYPKTLTINNTITETITKTFYKKPRFAVTLGGGLGYDFNKIHPYIGVNVGYVIWSK